MRPSIRRSFAVLSLLLLAADPAPPAPPAPPKADAPEASGLANLDFREVIRKAKDKVFPAVVYIRCIQESHEMGKKVSQEISGSGVLISAKGEMLTNWHVIDKATEIRCLLSDGRSFQAEVVGSDKDTDLALVRLRLANDSEAVPFAVIGSSSNLKEGDFVMAMGAPWGLNRSVSMGIIACTRRFLPDHSEYSLWLQTDASISPGNSGGPLVNTAGEIIGLNTRGVLQGGDMGFAVPSETIELIARQLREHGNVDWSWTGLQLQPLRDFNRNIVFEGKEGVVVAGTDPESPARRAGFQARDRILRVNGTATNAMTEEDLPTVRKFLGLLPKNAPSKFEIVRDGKASTLELAPREKGKVEGDELDLPRWDFTVKTINQFDNPDLFFHRKEGIFVYGIKHPGNASGAGLSTKDILLEIDGKAVKTLEDVRPLLKSALESVQTRHKIVLTVLRNGLMRQVVLDFSRDFEKE